MLGNVSYRADAADFTWTVQNEKKVFAFFNYYNANFCNAYGNITNLWNGLRIIQYRLRYIL